jgi:hypothetical protein
LSGDTSKIAQRRPPAGGEPEVSAAYGDIKGMTNHLAIVASNSNAMGLAVFDSGVSCNDHLVYPPCMSELGRGLEA